MKTEDQDKRMEALKQDPDYRALVKVLELQTPEQVESFYSHYEHEEKEEVADVSPKFGNGEEVQ